MSYKEKQEMAKKGLNPDGSTIQYAPDDVIPFRPAVEVPAKGPRRWDYIARVLSSGSGSVSFVTFRNGVSSVVKGSSTVVQEIFAHEVALGIGIPVPGNMRLIPFSGSEFGRMKAKLAEATRETDMSTYIRLKKDLNRPFLIEMDLIPVHSVYDLHHHALTGEAMSRDALEDLGALLAFDVFLNNWDRVPAVWNNEGNGNNLLYGTLEGARAVGVSFDLSPEDKASPTALRTVAIDHCITSVDEARAGKYLQKVQAFVEDVFGFATASAEEGARALPMDESAPPCTDRPLLKVRRWLYTITMADIGAVGEHYLRIGAIRTLQRLLGLFDPTWGSNFAPKLEQMKKSLRVRYDCMQDWGGVWQEGVGKISTPFAEAVLSGMHKSICGLAANENESIPDICQRFQEENHFHVVRLEKLRFLGKSFEDDVVKITVFQIPGLTALQAAMYLDQFLHEERSQIRGHDPLSQLTWTEKQKLNRVATTPAHPLTDVVIFPEGWWQEAMRDIQSELPKFRIADVCRKHQVYALLGSGIECVKEKGERRNYVTAALMSPSGTLLGRYRKQVHPGYSPSLSVGTDDGFISTLLGRIGILICFDIENQSIREKLLKMKPWLVLNPVHIAQKPMARAKGESLPVFQARMRRNHHAVRCGMSDKFERMVREHGFVLVRCDLPNAGTSQVISPDSTVVAAEQRLSIFSTFVDRKRLVQPNDPDAELQRTAQLPHLSRLLRLPADPRSKKEDNRGTRYRVQPLLKGDAKKSDYFHEDGKGLFLPATGMVAHGGGSVGLSLVSLGDPSNERKGCPVAAVLSEDGKVWIWSTRSGGALVGSFALLDKKAENHHAVFYVSEGAEHVTFHAAVPAAGGPLCWHSAHLSRQLMKDLSEFICDVSLKNPILTKRVGAPPASDDARPCFAVDADGDVIGTYYVTAKGEVAFLSVEGDTVVLQAPERPVCGLHYLPLSQVLVVGLEDCSIRFIPVAPPGSSATLDSPPLKVDGGVTAAAEVSPDLWVAGTGAGRVQVVHVERSGGTLRGRATEGLSAHVAAVTGALVLRVPGEKEGVVTVLTSSADGIIALSRACLDSDGGTLLYQFRSHTYPIACLDCDGSIFASTDTTGVTNIWSFFSDAKAAGLSQLLRPDEV